MSVAEAIEAAYRVFAAYPAPATLDAAPMRDGPKILAVLTAGPLRTLSADNMEGFASWALTTVGSVADFKHFLPRILELATDGARGVGYEPATLACKLKLASWSTWPAVEQRAVEAVLTEALRRAWLAHPDNTRVDEWISGCASLRVDLRPCLEDWSSARTAHALTQLAAFLEVAQTALPVAEGTWADADEDVRRGIADWLCGRAVEEALVAATDVVAAEDQWRLDAADIWRFNLTTATWRHSQRGSA